MIRFNLKVLTLIKGFSMLLIWYLNVPMLNLNPSMYRVTQKTGTFEMRSGSHVQLAAQRNRDLELQTTLPFSNHGSVER
jgi:hypothetical protein